MGLGFPTSSTKRNDPTIGNHHLIAPLGDFKVEGANVRTSTPVIGGTTTKQVAVAPNTSVNVIGFVTRKAEGDRGTSWSADFAAATIVNAEAGYGVIRQLQLKASENVAALDYLCAAGDYTVRKWISGTDAEASKIARTLQASNVGAVAKIAAFCLK